MLRTIVVSACLAYLAYFLMTAIQEQRARSKGSQLKGAHMKHLMPPNVEVPQPPSMSTLHVYEQAAVCSDRSACSNVGSVLMQQGGNAIDAAIGTLLCNGLVTMQSMGLGGGVLMTYYSFAKRQAVTIVGRERAPLKDTASLYAALGNASSVAHSPLAIAVPGEVAAYYEAHTNYGSLPWRQLVEPTVDLCRQGYHLTRHQRDSLMLNKEMIEKDDLLRSMFIDFRTQEFHREGTLIRPPSVLCNTYQVLEDEGPGSFYNGSLAEKVVSDLQGMGSLVDEEDLLLFRAETKSALQVHLDPYVLHLPAPPGSGHVVALVMNILHKFREEFRSEERISSREIHRIVEALKFGFVQRWEHDADIKEEILHNLTSLEYAEGLFKLIDDRQTYEDPTHYRASVDLRPCPDQGTAHISVMAPNGDAVAATSSINFYFGSGRMGRSTGIVFNNAMSDFSIDNFKNYFNLPNVPHRNRIKPAAQPMSSMTPLIVTDGVSGEVRLVVGAAGGTRIISTLVQILIRTLWLGQNIKQAIDAPRFHHQLLPNVLQYEFGVLNRDIKALEAKGHITERIRRKNTAVCGIERVTEAVLVNADYRKEGGVDGF